MLHRRGQNLVEARTVLGIGSMRRNQVVLGGSQVALLQEHAGGGRSTELQLLQLRVQALLVVVARSLGCFDGCTII